MSDSEDSTVTYTEAPPSPDYVPGPEHPPLTVYVPYVPEPVYPSFMPPEDEVFPAKEQPLPAAVSPTTNSPGYIADSDLEEVGEDPEEDPADYPVDEGDDDDDDDEEEEESHMMSVRAQTPISLPSDTKVVRLLVIPTLPPSPLSPLSSPLPQILSPPLLVSPTPLPTSPTYPLGYRAAMIWLRSTSPSTSHLLPLPSLIVLPHTRASVAMTRAAAPSTYILASRSETLPLRTPPLLTIPLPTPLLLPSTDCRAGVSEVTLPPWKRLCIALGPGFEVGESSSTPNARPTRGFRVDYRFVGTLDDEIKRYPERESMDASDTSRSEVRALRTTVLAQQAEILGLRIADHTK
ncbi:hypothetical protein Tco_0873962 [Tanacetum coccineum]|uniref:Uncharacterized protein n=1 Tax=Tanacetum coccineum TaxID=301880 RepID=A0ABQ5BNF0_9ASTR